MCKIKFAGGRLKMSSYVSANNLAFIKSDIHLGPVHQSSSVRVTTDHDRGSGEKQRKERRKSSRPEVAIPTYPTPFLRLSARLTYSISPDSIAPLPQCFKAAKRSIGIPVLRLLAGHTQKTTSLDF